MPNKTSIISSLVTLTVVLLVFYGYILYNKYLPMPQTTNHNVEKIIDLPNDYIKGDMDVWDAIENRRSFRNYSTEALSLQELATLLRATQGITGEDGIKRSAPSAGGLYPMETYLVINNVQGLETGLYHYNVEKNNLELLHLGDFRSELKKNAFEQQVVVDSAVNFIWTAVPERTTKKYGERGHRYIDVEAGHISQNLYLQGTAMNLGVVAVGGFDVDGMNEFLEIDGVYETVIYMNAVGKK